MIVLDQSVGVLSILQTSSHSLNSDHQKITNLSLYDYLCGSQQFLGVLEKIGKN